MTLRHDIQPLIIEFQQANGRGNSNNAVLALMKMIGLLVSRLDELASTSASAPAVTSIFTNPVFTAQPFMPPAVSLTSWPPLATPVATTQPWSEPVTESTIAENLEETMAEESPEADEEATDDCSSDESAPPVKRKRGRPPKNGNPT